MEKRIINSFGNITIPARIRRELGIDGNVLLWIDVRELKNGEKEIVLRRSNDAEEVLDKYQKWAEVISRITECSVSIVWNGKVLSMSSTSLTENFIEKNISVNPLLLTSFKKISSGGAIVDDPKSLSFLPNGDGEVAAYFKINGTGDDSCFFVVIKGTKYDGKKISKAEEERRLHIVNDILEKI